MRIHIKHIGEDYAGVSFSFKNSPKKKYAEVSLSDLEALKGVERVAKAILEKYPDNDDLD